MIQSKNDLDHRLNIQIAVSFRDIVTNVQESVDRSQRCIADFNLKNAQRKMHYISMISFAWTI